MRYPPGHRYRTHARILQIASRLFKAHGYAATSVDSVMEAAGLTAGGFYSHFRSKDTLFAETLDAQLGAQATRWMTMGAGEADSAWVRGFISGYLSPSHRDGREGGCAIPCLAPDVARAGKVEHGVFERHISEFLEHLSHKLRKRAAFAVPIFALCVGGVTLSRALANRRLADSVLASCRDAALRLAGLSDA